MVDNVYNYSQKLVKQIEDSFMQNRNISDIIERYLKSILAEASQVEIKRSEVADQFDCVPSQINYVIKTRFTLQNGYLVESKRGGGGYIPDRQGRFDQ